MQFWSDTQNDCTLPGCTSASVTLPGSMKLTTTTINYTYDPLNRLTAADYLTGDYYHYTYDEVGNRLSQDSSLNNQQTTTNYTYDIANRMIQAGNATYTWDNNGNLRNDGASTYTYDPANRLAGVVQGSNTYTYAYNGLGDRLPQTVNGQTTNYTLDLNAGLPQVLEDGTNTYTYGVDRISQQHGSTAEYYLDDALGSVRQLTDANDAITLSESYDPYGNVISSVRSSGTSIFGYTGEQADQTGLTYLRARYYTPYLNQFIQPDTIVPDPYQPADWNQYTYTRDNPINYTDPSGHCSGKPQELSNPDIACWQEIALIEATYSNIHINPDNWKTAELNAVQTALVGMTSTLGGQKNFTLIYNKTITIYRANWFESWITGDTQGATAVGPGTVTLYDDAFATSYDIGAAVTIHEFGHLLDARFGYLSMASDFRNKFWSDCEPNYWGDDCSRIFHSPQCNGLPASVYSERSPKEDFADLFAWYVWKDNGWDLSMLYSEFMPPDQERLDYMENIISAIKQSLSKP